MTKTQEREIAAQAVIDATYDKANAIWQRDFPRPKLAIVYSMGCTAGQAVYATNTMRLNAELFAANEVDMLAQTVPHECAHFIARDLHGERVQHHGIEWITIMIKLGLNPKRCHNYDTKHVRRSGLSWV